MDKGTLRRRMKAVRQDFWQKEAERKGEEERILSYAVTAAQGFDAVLVYDSFGSEVETKEIGKTLREMGKKLYFPKMEGPELLFYLVEREDELIPHSFGMREPAGNTACYAEGKALVLVPGLGFDERGYRLGYGGGYYDRFLAKHPDVTALGLSFRCQLVGQVPGDCYDQRLTGLVTADGIRLFRK